MVATSSPIHYQQVLRLGTHGKSLGRFTRKVQEAVTASCVHTGLCTIFVRHTSASLVIQENADPDVLADMETFLSKLVPEGDYYRRYASTYSHGANPYLGTNSGHSRKTRIRHVARYLSLGASRSPPNPRSCCSHYWELTLLIP